MKIAFISLMGGLPWGGSEALWSATAIKAIESGHQIFVSVYDWDIETNNIISELKKKGSKIHLRKKWSTEESLLKKVKRTLAQKFSNLSEDWKALINFHPELVLISQGGNFDLTLHHKELYYILKNKEIPFHIICHSHQQYSEIPDSSIYPIAKEVFLRAETVFFVSYRQWQLTERKLCTKLPNASFTWNPLNIRDAKYLQWPEIEIPQLAIVGALVSGKGHDTLFEALSSEKWKNRIWQLNIYGKGNGENYLKDLASYLKIENKIVFHGHVASATEIWGKNHILLIPSSGEGLPISLVEASICGRPAVVTDVGGNSEIIKDSENGFISEAPSVGSFEKTMERAWQSIKDWKKMGTVANKLIINKFDYKPEITLLKKLLKQND